MVCFANMKAAFDRLKREKIWERLGRKEVNRNLVRRIRSLFERIRAKVEIGGEIIDEFGVKEGVRQGCPLSPTLFNVAMTDLEEEIGKVQGSGAWLGKKKRIKTIAYADDIALIAEDEEVMKDMLKKFKNWSGKKGLELKTRIMLFRKKRGRRKGVTFKWNDGELEMVRKFDYLRYILKGNNSDGEHIRMIKGKTNGTVGRIWSIAKRRFKNAWDLRMRLFEIMVKGVVMYGAENWGWREWNEIECIKMKYVRWTLKLNRTTPWHTI